MGSLHNLKESGKEEEAGRTVERRWAWHNAEERPG